MKRIHNIRVAPVLALLASFAAMGCLGQTSNTESTDESAITGSRAHDSTNADANAASAAEPAQVLELQTRPGDANQNPHPEPWLDQEGPHPEPWQSKYLTFVLSDPLPGGRGTKKP